MCVKNVSKNCSIPSNHSLRNKHHGVYVYTRMHTSLLNREVSSRTHGCLFIQMIVHARVHKEERREPVSYLLLLHHITLISTISILLHVHTSQQSQQAHRQGMDKHAHYARTKSCVVWKQTEQRRMYLEMCLWVPLLSVDEAGKLQ